MRLSCGPIELEHKEIVEFPNWLLKIREGRWDEPNDGTTEIKFPPDMLITQFDDPVVTIVKSTYPDFLANWRDYDYLKSRAILASTIEMVDKINDHVLAMMPCVITSFIVFICIFFNIHTYMFHNAWF